MRKVRGEVGRESWSRGVLRFSDFALEIGIPSQRLERRPEGFPPSCECFYRYSLRFRMGPARRLESIYTVNGLDHRSLICRSSFAYYET